MSLDNPAITRKDAREIAAFVNAALLDVERWKSPEQAISVLAVAMATVVARDGRICAQEFLKLCGIEKGPYSRIVVDAMKGLNRLVETKPAVEE